MIDPAQVQAGMVYGLAMLRIDYFQAFSAMKTSLGGKMPTPEQFIALSVRNVRVIKAMTQAMEAMQVVDLAAVEVAEGARYKLNFAPE